MFDASVPVLLIPGSDVQRFYNELLKISGRERKKRLTIYVWMDSWNVEENMEKVRSIISLNQLLSMSFYVVRQDLEVLKSHHPSHIYVVFPETRKEVAQELIRQLSELGIQAAEVVIPEL
jgi:hypothetical protein